MSAKSIEAQLERMVRELIAIAKTLDCSVHLDVTKYDDGTYGGSVFKINKSAVSFDFCEGKKSILQDWLPINGIWSRWKGRMKYERRLSYNSGDVHQ